MTVLYTLCIKVTTLRNERFHTRDSTATVPAPTPEKASALRSPGRLGANRVSAQGAQSPFVEFNDDFRGQEYIEETVSGVSHKSLTQFPDQNKDHLGSNRFFKSSSFSKGL